MKEKTKVVTFRLDGLKIGAIVLAIVLALICWGYKYLVLPVSNVNVYSMWFRYTLLGLCIASIIKMFFWYQCDIDDIKAIKIITNALLIAPCILFVVTSVIAISHGAMFNAKSYYQYVSNKVTVVGMDETSTEAEAVMNIAFPDLTADGTDNLPLYGIPEASAKSQTLLGSMPALGSQMELKESEYTSQSINNSLTYVVPLEPVSMFKWDKNDGNGGYFTIDRNSGKTEFVQNSLKYTNNAPFNSNAKRKMYELEKKYKITDISPEVADDGTFYYVGTTYDYESLGGIKYVTGVIVLNAITGEEQFYTPEEAPSWIDRIYPEEFFADYISWYGKYKNGYWNSLIKKKGVQIATKDSDVVYVNGTCYAYTGWTTSKSGSESDSSNGIIMMNLKTGEIFLYENYGISESKAQSVAEGKVQEKEYTASYPILLEIGGEPSYFMLMRDKGDNLTGYAFVDYKDHTKVAVADNLNDAQTMYYKVLATSNSSEGMNNIELAKAAGKISGIASEVVESNTIYYVKIEGSEVIYTMTSSLSKKIVFAQVGDEIEISYIPAEDADVISATDITIK